MRDPDFIKKLAEEIKQIEWPYVKLDVIDQLHSRDQALAALLILIGPRISEALLFQRKMFLIRGDRIEVMDFQPGKHGNLRTGLFLPLNKNSTLFPITEIFLTWLKQVPNDPEAFIFPSAKPWGIIHWNRPIERGRAHWIIKSTIGKFPHALRGVCETYIGKIVFSNDPYKLKDFMGVRRIENVFPYVGEPWRQDLERANQ